MERCRVRRFARVAAVFVIAATLSAQQNNGSAPEDAELVALLSAAKASFAERNWDRAAADYQKLLSAARAKDAALWEGRAILGFGRIANESARYVDARRHALEALAIFERFSAADDVGDANTTLAIAAGSVNDYETEKTHYARAVEAYRAAGNDRGRVQASFRLLTIPSNTLESFNGFGELQAEAHALDDKNLEGQILHAWGDKLFTRSLYKPAIEKVEAAAALFQETNNRLDLGTTYNSLGRLYRAHGQPRAALEFQLKALKIHETLNRPRELIQSLNAVAVASQVAGEIDQARVYYERALAAAERTGVQSYIDFMRANLGAFLVQSEGDVDRGRDLIERAIAGNPGAATSGRHAQLSEAYLKLGRHQDALAAAERALNACRTPVECIGAHAADGRVQLARGNDAAALADQKEILAAVEKMHATLPASDLLKQNFQRLWEDAYSIAIELHFRRGEFREALESSELARSRAFLDLLATRQLEGPAPALTLRGAAAGSASDLSSTRDRLRSDVSAPPPTIEGLTSVAARLQSTLLTYWVSANSVYVWTLSPDGRVHGARVSLPRSTLDALIRSIAPFTPARARPSASATIATRGEQRIAMSARSHRAWRDLYDALIAPVERELPRAAGARLTIVPHGPLLSVPFAALIDARGRYLVERYTIHSVPAGAVLQFTGARPGAGAHAGAVLLVGDPARPPRISGDPPLPRLAGASEEVRTIARLMPASRTTTLTGGTATEPRVRAALPGKAVIHFATHGIVRDANPLASFLALGTVGDGAADGQLTTDEIYGLDLDATLVVLSACRSGGGVISGDGIAGLARAFFYAGTSSVIVSVWDVADEPTNRLLPVFYRAWLNGADKAAALRAAQLSLIRNLRAGRIKVALPAGTFVLPEDPAFWAAFVLLGEPD
jgi:CHAT domain-containing protein/tetratricopeptide (TPR) repeat protein